MAIFNRSHYEDVGVVRVHELAPREVWRARYEQINQFESLLAANRTIILKFFLHISKEEQEERLLAREQEVEKSWKLSVGDWKERQHWEAYQEAYSDAIGMCAALQAPWFVVPADRKWFRNLAIAETIVEVLRPFRDGWLESLKKVGEVAKAELAAFRAEKT
jgi:polyphosphate kinase 2 (PPK2 family)